MAFLTALFDAYGGYGAGKQQRFDDTLRQQQAQQSQTQTDIESQKWTEMRRQMLQNRGIDPDTMQPYQMPQNLTNATGGQPNKGHATLQQLVDWHMARAHEYRRTGQTDSANDEVNAASNLQGIQGQQMSSENILNRQLLLRGIPTWGQQQMYNYDQSAGLPYGMRPTYSDYWNLQNNLPPWYRAPQAGTNPALTTEGKIVGQVKGRAAEMQAKFKNDWAVATKMPHDPLTNSNVDSKTGQILEPKLSLDEQTDFATAQGYLTQENDPKKVRSLAAQMARTKNKTYNDLVKEYAEFRAEQLEYQQRQTHYTKGLEDQQTQQQQGGYGYGGGSYGPGNPTGVRPKLGADTIWDMLVQNGATPQEATILAAVAQAESGGDPTNVNPTDNHGKQTSWGLFQISDGTHNEPQGWNNPLVNVQMAIQKLRTQGLTAWGTYNTGAYKKFLPAGVPH